MPLVMIYTYHDSKHNEQQPSLQRHKYGGACIAQRGKEIRRQNVRAVQQESEGADCRSDGSYLQHMAAPVCKELGDDELVAEKHDAEQND